MSDWKHITLGALAITTLTYCGVRERGLEVAVDLVAGEAPVATLQITRMELLACPDDPRMVLTSPFVSIARAHDSSTPFGAVSLSFPNASAMTVVPVMPGAYCDLRITLGDATTSALVEASGDAPQRQVVLRIVGDDDAPVRLGMASAPDRAELRVTLGAFDASDSPEHALTRMFDGAAAHVISR